MAKGKRAARRSAAKKQKPKLLEITKTADDPFVLFRRAYSFVVRFRVLGIPVGVGLVAAWVVGAQINGCISDTSGTAQSVAQVLAKKPQEVTPPRLSVSPSFRVIEPRGAAEERFPISVVNHSPEEVSGEMLRLEVRPPMANEDFFLEPLEHDQIATAKSPSGATAVDVDMRGFGYTATSLASVHTADLGVVGGGKSANFTAVVRNRRGLLLQVKSSIDRLDGSADMARGLRFAHGLPAPDASFKGMNLLIVRDADAGEYCVPPHCRRTPQAK